MENQCRGCNIGLNACNRLLSDQNCPCRECLVKSMCEYQCHIRQNAYSTFLFNIQTTPYYDETNKSKHRIVYKDSH